MEIQTVLLTQIDLTASTQARVMMSEETVTEYRDLILDGVELPPITVYYDGAKHYCSDGFHRLRAHKAAGKIVIQSVVILGTQDDATYAAAGANVSHGLRRTNADKRKALSMALGSPRAEGLSDREIARHCGVNHHLVADVRRKLGMGVLPEAKETPLRETIRPTAEPEPLSAEEKAYALGKVGSSLGSYNPGKGPREPRDTFGQDEAEDVLRIPETRFDRLPIAQGLPGLASCLEQIAENTTGDVATLAGWVAGQLSAMAGQLDPE